MTKPQLDEFYDMNTVGSFGADLMRVLNDTSTKYSCADANAENMAGITLNCTTLELSSLQWSSA